MKFFRMKKAGNLFWAAFLGVGSVQAEDFQIHSSEGQSFEELLEKREENSRRPASMFLSTARVIGVRRSLSLSEAQDSQNPQDIILNGGIEKGLVKGSVMKVRRKVPFLDPYSGNEQKELEVDFALIEVVHSQSGLSVARLKELFPVEQNTALGTLAILVGDYVGQ